jgi:hypothetical protein
MILNMALAKYCEDIDDRYTDDNFERLNALFSGRDFSKEWRQLARVDSAAVVARFSGGYFEDRMVFLRPGRTRFSVESASKIQHVMVTFSRFNDAAEELSPDETGAFEIHSPKADGELTLRCGNYSKTYRITFLDKPKPEVLPDVKPALAALVHNPARWTNAGFEKLRGELDTVLSLPGIPPDFATGVKEFYLGLFHESIGEANYRKRIETAFNVLRPFCAFSDYAQLICAYYLYRVNYFEQVVALHQIPLLSTIAKFFLSQNSASISRLKNKPTTGETEILVSDRDFELFQAITLFMEGNLKGCAKKISRAQAAGLSGLDTQGDERLTLIRARLASRSGKAPEAARFYGILTNSATDAIRAEANTMLNLQRSNK